MSEVKEKTSSQEEWVEKVLAVRRVAKVITGGRRFSFSALVVVGDRKGNIGVAIGKSREVASAITKAAKRAKSSIISIPTYKTTIPFSVESRHGASKVVIKSASKGTGVIAGGAVRAVMEAIGVQDVLTKSLGSSNPHNVVKATIKALSKLKTARDIANMRGKKISEIIGAEDVESK